MTEQEAAPVAEIPVMFQGREVLARMPSPEQILVWQRVLTRLAEAPMDASWTGEQVMKALDRLRRIVDTLLSPADIEWLDDQFLDGAITFQKLAPLIADITDAFAELDKKAKAEQEPNRPARRAARKKATPTT